MASPSEAIVHSRLGEKSRRSYWWCLAVFDLACQPAVFKVNMSMRAKQSKPLNGATLYSKFHHLFGGLTPYARVCVDELL